MDFNLFTQKYESFMNRCSDLNKNEAWDEDEYCEMSLFYESSMANLVLSLLASDGVIHEKEVDFINRFGIGSYTDERLQEIIGILGDNIDRYYNEDIIRDIDLLKKVDEGMAKEYTELVKAACELIISCDDEVTDNEKKRSQQLVERFH